MSLKDRLEKWLNYAVSAAIYEGMDEDGLAEIRQVRRALEQYVLVHESHIKEAVLLNGPEPFVVATIDVGVRRFFDPEESLFARFDFIGQEKYMCRSAVIRFLEQPQVPDPEQTQPDQP
jgi:hypothetical protein